MESTLLAIWSIYHEEKRSSHGKKRFKSAASLDKSLPENILTHGMPPRTAKWKWKPANKIGFLRGLFSYGSREHHSEIASLLNSSRFQELTSSARKTEIDAFITKMYNWYILPFKQNTGSECHSSESGVSSAKEGTHRTFKEALADRDEICLFCWQDIGLNGAHILAQKNVFRPDIDSLFASTEISHIHSVQNGLLLCSICHGLFDALSMYVEDNGDRMLVKYVNPTHDPKNQQWCRRMENLVKDRQGRLWRILDIRSPMDSDGGMRLWFASRDKRLRPSVAALELHKRACMIWRLAGGAESEDEVCFLEKDTVPSVPSEEVMDRVRSWNEQVRAQGPWPIDRCEPLPSMS